MMRTIEEILEIRTIISQLDDDEWRELINISKGQYTSLIHRAKLMKLGLVAFNHEMTKTNLTTLGISVLTLPLPEIV